MLKSLSEKIINKNQNKKSEEIRSYICAGCVFEGNIVISDGITRIDGEVYGNIKGEGGLLIGEKGWIKGDIEVKKVVVFGKVEGNITAEEVEVHSGSVIKGNVRTKVLYVEKGALINGLFEMNSYEKDQMSMSKIS
jgi:cytoskeletal protein CcmA (bactofilin family)